LLAWLALAILVLAILVQGLRSTGRARTELVPARNRLGRHQTGNGRVPAPPPARRSPSRASIRQPRSVPDEVVLTLAAPVETPAATATESTEAAHEAPAISVSVLGPLQIMGGKRRRRLRGSAQELIAYLALRPEGATRDQLLEALWPGEDPKRSEQRLWQSTSDVRRALGGVICRKDDRYFLDRTQVSADVDELERLLAAAWTAKPGPAQPLMERALALFDGEPLSGSDYAWAEGELRRLRVTHVDLLERVGRGRLAAGEPRAALDAAEGGLAIDSLNEELWRLALEAEGALGLREAVAERYDRLRGVLDKRLGLEPAQETRLLYRRLLGQR
jgi:two-component SAPR family response regulator